MDNIEKKDIFLNRLANTFTDAEWLEYVGTQVYKSFRIINREHTDEILHELDLNGIVVIESSVPNAYSVIKNFESLSSTNSFRNGDIYIQGLSSMLPVNCMNISADARVLDMTAAPGSKSIQLFYNNIDKNIELVLTEKDFKRYRNLLDNLKKYKVEHGVEAYNIDANFIAKIYPKYQGYFDNILLDAPCSTEIELNPNNLSSFKFWNTKKTSLLAKIQKQLFSNAIKLLKPGGELIYSTCTYSVHENEEVIDFILNKFPNVYLDNIDLNIPNILDGLTLYQNKQFHSSLSKTKRVLPNEFMTGFYIAKLRLI